MQMVRIHGPTFVQIRVVNGFDRPYVDENVLALGRLDRDLKTLLRTTSDIAETPLNASKLRVQE
jgi:hypothetical protein